MSNPRYITYSDWIYEGKILNDIPKDAIGFVYIITRTNIDEDIEDPIYYVGKKFFRTKQNSDDAWKSYYGSSIWLHESIEKHGIHNFTREILHITYSKSETTYKEVMEQIDRRVLKVDYNSKPVKKYYNKNILGKFYSDSVFTKKDIDRIKTYRESNDYSMNKIAVTNGVITKYVYIDTLDIHEWFKANPGWVIGTVIHNNNSGKVYITNDTITKYIEDYELDLYLSRGWKLYSNTSWNYGLKCITDGETNIWIPENNIDTYISMYPTFYVGTCTKGKMIQVYDINTKKAKRVHTDDVDIFLLDNPTWTKVYPKSTPIDFVSIIHEDLYQQFSVPVEVVDTYITQGFRVAKYKETISSLKKWCTKDGINIKIQPKDIDKYLQDGWKLGRSLQHTGKSKNICSKATMKERLVTRVSNNITKESREIPIDSLDVFLLNNNEWYEGYLSRGYGTTNNIVFAIDTDTNDKVTVTKEHFRANKTKYVGINTKKVTIYKDNTEVFSGYLIKWITFMGYPEYPFKVAIRSKGIVGAKGKYEWLQAYKYTIKENND